MKAYKLKYNSLFCVASALKQRQALEAGDRRGSCWLRRREVRLRSQLLA